MAFLNGIGISQDQRWQSPALVPFGVITKDKDIGPEVFILSPDSRKKFQAKFGRPVYAEAGVDFYKVGLRDFAAVAKASSKDLEKAVADLISRVDALEKRVAALEKKVK